MCPVLDGLIVGTYVQNTELGKKSWKRKAVILTDGQNPLEIEDEDVDNTVNKLNDWGVELTVMYATSLARWTSDMSCSSGFLGRGVDFDDPDFPFEEVGKPKIKVSMIDVHPERPSFNLEFFRESTRRCITRSPRNST